MFAIAASTVTSWGLYVLLPIFIAFLFFLLCGISLKRLKLGALVLSGYS